MPRSTLIVGNGLGMALDPDFFHLDYAMEEVWKRPHYLSRSQKNQIRRCLDAQGIHDRPHGEDDLDVLHLAVLACRLLQSIASPQVRWLTQTALRFPLTIEKYITSVAWHFHHFHGDALPEPFIDSLASYLADTRSHIATVNYDNLLYQKLIEVGILHGYDGPLVDGFYVNQGVFRANQLERIWGNNFGYYLHLHGSPLFIDNHGVPTKQRQGFGDENIPTPHLVLTRVKHKRSVIANSYLLTTYWDYFERGLSESKRILIFGYSGLDTHLNEVITKYSRGREIIVIEWSGAGSKKSRSAYWRQQLKVRVGLILMENILEFTDWERA